MLYFFSRWKKKQQHTLTNSNDVSAFLAQHSAHITGKLVIDYADHRTGKLRWKLMEEAAYVAHLQAAHITIHAHVLVDLFWISVGKYCNDTATNTHYIETTLDNIHTRYCQQRAQTEQSTDDGMVVTTQQSGHLAAHARATADVARRALPFTDGLDTQSQQVFFGQLRSLYIYFNDTIQKKMHPDLAQHITDGTLLTG